MPDEHDPYPGPDERLSPAPPTGEPSRVRKLASLAVIDIGPLRRRRDFRLLFFGQGLSFFGSMLTYVAVPFQAYELTGSSFTVGLLSLVALPPVLVTAFLGGAIADAVDRRRLVQVAEVGLALCAAALLLNTVVGDARLWVLFVVEVVSAAFYGIQRPPLDALMPRLVERDELAAASAIDSLLRNLGMVVGPAVAGILIAAFGLAATYAVDLVTFSASIIALSLMRAVPPPPDADRPSVRGVIDGIRYAKSRPELVGTYGVDFVAMFFGMPTALYPAFANEFGGPEVLGLLYAAPSIGSIAVTLTSGWTSRVHRHGMAVILAAMVWGVGITVVGFAPTLAVAVAGLAVAGGADMISGIFRSVIWNSTIPDRLRGRLAGIELISYSSGPILGDFEAGVVAALASVRTSIVSGGILCVAGVGILALALPAFRRYDAREHPAPTPAPTPAS